MSINRDLAWRYLNQLYHSSTSYQLARYAVGMSYKLLPPEVVHQAKRCVLDTLGCAIGAYDAPGRSICEAMVKSLGGVPESTVFGSGLRTSAPNATIVNSFLVRFLDANDLGGGGHNSDAISSILAVAEREKANGQDFITSLVISYELGARFMEFCGGDEVLERKGLIMDIRGGISMPPSLGNLMKLDEDQIANAIGICASRSFPLGILDTDKEENFMSKNLRFGFVCHDAILSCILAKYGFTGPVRVIEGQNGFGQTLLKNEMDIERFVDFSGWRIMDTRFKIYSMCGGVIGSVAATIDIVKENDLKPDDIASVKITVSPHNVRHMTCLAKKYPRNAESADHSIFYANAAAIKERAFGVDSFEPEKFTDPVILDLIEKMKVVGEASMPGYGFRGASEIVTKDSRRFFKEVDNPHGTGNDPLSDRDLEEKFRDMADKYISKEQIQKIFDAVWNLEKLDNMSELAGLMVFRP
jgi:2-methylcitrate dehydratase